MWKLNLHHHFRMLSRFVHLNILEFALPFCYHLISLNLKLKAIFHFAVIQHINGDCHCHRKSAGVCGIWQTKDRANTRLTVKSPVWWRWYHWILIIYVSNESGNNKLSCINISISLGTICWYYTFIFRLTERWIFDEK